MTAFRLYHTFSPKVNTSLYFHPVTISTIIYLTHMHMEKIYIYIWSVLLENNHLQGLDVFKLVSVPLFDLSVLSRCEKQMGFGDKLKEHYTGKGGEKKKRKKREREKETNINHLG